MAKTGRPPYVWNAAEKALGCKTGMWVLGCIASGLSAEAMRAELMAAGIEVHINTIRQWIKKVMG